jgi:hypothetical protein
MSYMSIENLYKAQEVLLFKRIFALEKIHGTSAHVGFRPSTGLVLFEGGASRNSFLALFDQEKLKATFAQFFAERAWEDVMLTVYGEAYGGKMQGMSATYGKELKFVAFEVMVGDTWLAVPAAEEVTRKLGFEFVSYEEIDGTVEAVQKALERDSEQAIRNGMGLGHRREGVVLRPPLELTKNNGGRIIAKHKNPEFAENKTPREIDPNKMKVLADANAIAEEWVTGMRLDHVLDAFTKPLDLSMTGAVIKAMIEDVVREAGAEIVDSKEARTAIGTRTAKVFKQKLNQSIQA